MQQQLAAEKGSLELAMDNSRDLTIGWLVICGKLIMSLYIELCKLQERFRWDSAAAERRLTQPSCALDCQPIVLFHLASMPRSGLSQGSAAMG